MNYWKEVNESLAVIKEAREKCEMLTEQLNSLRQAKDKIKLNHSLSLSLLRCKLLTIEMRRKDHGKENSEE